VPTPSFSSPGDVTFQQRRFPVSVPNSFQSHHDAAPEPTLFAVDDEADDRQFFARLLAAPGLEYPCQFFASGEEMIDALLLVMRGAPPPLACFIDVKMSGMNGFDVLRWIRCQRSLDDVPLVMLSSSDDPQKLGEARCFGAQCYMAKFPTPLQLRTVIIEAQRYSAARTREVAFNLPCNLLFNATDSGRPSAPGLSSPVTA
jgi:CheY-like chemotaxis protein